MARTKQTARMSMAQAICMKGGKGIGGKGLANFKGRAKQKTKRNGMRNRSRSSSSDSSQSVNVNVQQFSVRFDNQKECQANAIPYYVVQCHNCSAYLNSYSKVTQSLSGSQILKTNKSTKSNKRLSDQKLQELKNSIDKLWQCQFCLSNNLLPKSFVQIPPENPCYLISKGQNNANQQQDKGQKLIIYCIDVSGSMETNVQNKTRIAAVRQAIGDQIKRMKFQQQKVKIGIITFGSEVSVYTKTGNKNIPNITYYNFDNLLNEAKKIKGFASSINKQFSALVQNVQKLTTYGSTALGPALVTSLELASTGPKGSKIILCTDGEANVGINGPQFYTKAAGFAKQRGVVVSILSLKGDNCNLKELGKLTLSTGGSILKIEPKLLGSEFNKISKEQILGVESHLKIKLNHIFQIQNAEPSSLSADKTIMNQAYGSFNAQTQLTFNFKTLLKEQVQAKGFNNLLAEKQKGYMQIQLTYTSTDGSKYLQIITDYRQFTLNKQDLTKELNFGLFSASQLQKISTFIKDQNFKGARQEINYYNRLVEQKFIKTQKQSQIKKFQTKIRTLTNILTSKELKKKRITNPFKNPMKSSSLLIRASGNGRGRGLGRGRGRVRGISNLSDSDNSVSMRDEKEEENNEMLMQSDSQEMHLNNFKRARSVDND